MNISKHQNMGSQIREFGSETNSLSGKKWCLYLNFDFKKQNRENPNILQPGQKYYDLDDPNRELKTKK